ncbi:MAG: hypothetical protein HY898_28140 [Deltaproteobacteria bacterium]|nr:hypothetical protein [Deltaproteobacteria bacterium]
MGDIPESRETDHDDVQLALDVAKSRLANGDHAEAIKWLRKAADTAFDVGDDRRGIELSKAAAELKPGGGVPGPARPSPSTAPAAPTPGPAPVAPQLASMGAKISAPPSGLPKPLLKPTVPSASQMQSHPRVGRSNPPEKRPSKAPPAARTPTKPKSMPPIAPPVDPSSTDLRRVEGRPPLPERAADEEDATRELQISDQMQLREPAPVQTAAVTGDEWPTESVSHVSEVGDFTDRMQQAELLKQAADVVTSAPPLHSQAFRVAVGRSAEDGTIKVRLLDEAGLQEGEHDAMIVSVVPGEDLSELFRP